MSDMIFNCHQCGEHVVANPEPGGQQTSCPNRADLLKQVPQPAPLPPTARSLPRAGPHTVKRHRLGPKACLAPLWALLLLTILTSCGPHIDSPIPEERRQAVLATLDQTRLSQVALQDSDAGVRQAAVLKLTNQNLLAEIAIKDTDPKVATSAAARTSNEALLVQVGISLQDSPTARAAVERITSQSSLGQVALNATNHNVACLAAKRLTDQPILLQLLRRRNLPYELETLALDGLTDQAALAKLVIDTNGFSRERALKRLTNQPILAEIVSGLPPDYNLLPAAIRNLTDQNLLANALTASKIAPPKSGPFDLSLSIWNLNELQAITKAITATLTNQTLMERIVANAQSDTIRLIVAEYYCGLQSEARALLNQEEYFTLLNRMAAVKDASTWSRAFFLVKAGNMSSCTTRTSEAIARVRLAIREPPIRLHFPKLTLVVRVDRKEWPYSEMYGGQRKTVVGESVTFWLVQGPNTFATYQSETDFPTFTGNVAFLPAIVQSEHLLASLFSNPSLDSADLMELSTSPLPEVRAALCRFLGAGDILRKLADQDPCEAIRKAAQDKLAGASPAR